MAAGRPDPRAWANAAGPGRAGATEGKFQESPLAGEGGFIGVEVVHAHGPRARQASHGGRATVLSERERSERAVQDRP